MRLVDAEELKIQGYRLVHIDNLNPNIERISWCNVPIAYDVDKVVAAIKKIHCKKCRNILGVAGAEEYCKGQKCEIEELCDIVRIGGVE